MVEPVLKIYVSFKLKRLGKMLVRPSNIDSASILLLKQISIVIFLDLTLKLFIEKSNNPPYLIPA